MSTLWQQAICALPPTGRAKDRAMGETDATNHYASMMERLRATPTVWRHEVSDGWARHIHPHFAEFVDGHRRWDSVMPWPECLPTYDSPWLSWNNFNGALCGEDHGVDVCGTEFELLNVIAGRRPSGGDIAWFDDDPPTKAERFQDIMEVARARGLVVRHLRPANVMGHAGLGNAVFVAQDATFGDLFDLSAVADIVEAALTFVDRHPEVVGRPERFEAFRAETTRESLLGLSERPCHAAQYWFDLGASDISTEGLPRMANTLALGYPIEAQMASEFGWTGGTARKPESLLRLPGRP